MEKCHQIVRLNPLAKVYVCPVLPTRDMRMNQKAMYMNRRVQMHIKDSFNITMLDCNSFVNSMGLLKNTFCSRPGDLIHMGQSGISKLVSIIKERIHHKVPFVTKRTTTRVDGRSYASVSSVNRHSVHSEVNREGSVNMMMPQHTTGNTYTASSQSVQS